MLFCSPQAHKSSTNKSPPPSLETKTDTGANILAFYLQPSFACSCPLFLPSSQV